MEAIALFSVRDDCDLDQDFVSRHAGNGSHSGCILKEIWYCTGCGLEQKEKNHQDFWHEQWKYGATVN